MAIAQKAQRKRPVRALAKSSPARLEDALFARVLQIVDAARGHAARSVNTTMVHAYWMIGREIVEVEQAGEKRAGYGDELLKRLGDGSPGGSARGSARGRCAGSGSSMCCSLEDRPSRGTSMDRENGQQR
ncbi:MAG: hypothetical protein IPH44_20005 [Myxococcales bacterium]|nr:hypothetical protein [Myxococcales bacterium]